MVNVCMKLVERLYKFVSQSCCQKRTITQENIEKFRGQRGQKEAVLPRGTFFFNLWITLHISIKLRAEVLINF